jgi:hypothetical protein
MALPTPRPAYEETLVVSSSFTVTGGGTISVATPYRGVIGAIYLAPADGGAITGSATLTVSVENVSVGTLAMAASAAGFASGGPTAFSPRAPVIDGDIIKLALGAGMTNGTFAIFSIIIRQATS